MTITLDSYPTLPLAPRFLTRARSCRTERHFEGSSGSSSHRIPNVLTSASSTAGRAASSQPPELTAAAISRSKITPTHSAVTAHQQDRTMIPDLRIIAA
jgi:hypothetical protein